MVEELGEKANSPIRRDMWYHCHVMEEANLPDDLIWFRRNCPKLDPNSDIYKFYIEIRCKENVYTKIEELIQYSKVPNIMERYSKFVTELKSLGLLECSEETFHKRYGKEYKAFAEDKRRFPPQRPFIMYPTEGKNMSRPTVDEVAHEAMNSVRNVPPVNPKLYEPIIPTSLQELMDDLVVLVEKIQDKVDYIKEPEELNKHELLDLLQKRISDGKNE